MAFAVGSSKYGSKKIEAGGIVFDSKKEYIRWNELRIMEKAGAISNLRRQVEFELIPTQREPDRIGKRGGIHKGCVIEKQCVYISDFVYEVKGSTVVEDVKGGKRTEAYIIKRKLMLWLHGIRIREV